MTFEESFMTFLCPECGSDFIGEIDETEGEETVYECYDCSAFFSEEEIDIGYEDDGEEWPGDSEDDEDIDF